RHSSSFPTRRSSDLGAVVLRVHEVFDTLADAHVLAFRSRTSRTSGISIAIVACTLPSSRFTNSAVSPFHAVDAWGYQTLAASFAACLASLRVPWTVSTQTPRLPCSWTQMSLVAIISPAL